MADKFTLRFKYVEIEIIDGVITHFEAESEAPQIVATADAGLTKTEPPRRKRRKKKARGRK